MSLVSVTPALSPTRLPASSSEQGLILSSSHINQHLQDVSASSYNLTCHSSHKHKTLTPLARFIHSVWPRMRNEAPSRESAEILAFGHQLMNRAVSLKGEYESASALLQPPFHLRHKKYAWGAGLLVFGQLTDASALLESRRHGVTLTRKPAAFDDADNITLPCVFDSVSSVHNAAIMDYSPIKRPPPIGASAPANVTLSRMPRALNFRHHVERDLNSVFALAGLPERKKERLLGVILREFRTTAFSKKNKIRSENERLIALDIILLRLGARPGADKQNFQKLGEEIRRLLKDIGNSLMVSQYVKASPPHFPPNIPQGDADRMLDEFFDMTQQHEIQEHHFFSANSHLLDELMINICEKKFSQYVSDFGIPLLNQTHDVEFEKKYIILLFKPYVTHVFTTKEIFLGIHKRYAVQDGMVNIIFPPHTHKFITSVLDAKPDITDYIERELIDLYNALSENKEFERLFKLSLSYRVKGIILSHMDVVMKEHMPQSVLSFLKDGATPHVATLQGKVIPNLLLFTDPENVFFVIISLTRSELKVFEKNTYDESLGEFVLNHLSIFEQQRIAVGALDVRIMCDAGSARNNIYAMYCDRPGLGHEYCHDYPDKLYSAMLDVLYSNINSITYTNVEYRRDDTIALIQNLIFKLDCILGMVSLVLISPLISALWATIGVGTGVSSFFINKKVMDTTDNGALYESALSEAVLGAWFTAFGAVLDIGSSGKLIANSFKAYKAKRLIGLGKASLTSPHVSEELKGMIKPKMYDRQVQGERLSSPDIRGLQWSIYNISYLKINDNYVKVVKGKNNEIYYVGKSKIVTKFTRGGEFIPIKKNAL